MKDALKKTSETNLFSETISEKDISEKEYLKLKLRLEDLQKRGKRKPILFMWLLSTVVFGSMILYYYGYIYYQEMTFPIVFASLILGGLIGSIIALYFTMLFEIKESRMRRAMLEYEAENIQDEVKEDIFENSIKMSYKYLDQYYLQTREQAQRGFLVTVCVSVFGAILIGVGIGAMFLGKTDPSYITCASGVITEFIAAIFFYLYNKTVSSMSKYHNKLVLSQNISISLKVADTLPPEDKIKAKNIIISELLKDVNSYLITSDATDKKE